MQDNRDKSKLESGQATMEHILNKAEADQNLALAEDTGENGIIEISDFKIVDAHLQSEVLEMVGGLYEPEAIYNIPKTTANGKESWTACKRMPYGCKYERDKIKHIHIVDVGIHGARIAAQAYGGLEYGPCGRPVITEEGGKAYWVVEVECYDTIRNLRIKHWQFTEVLVKWGQTITELEHGAAIVQAKGLRKVILSVVPPQLRRVWITDYMEGKPAFNPQRILEMDGGRQGVGAGRQAKALPSNTRRGTTTPPTKPTPPKKETEKPTKRKAAVNAAEVTLESVTREIAKLMDVPFERLKQYSAGPAFNTPGQATLLFVRAKGNPETHPEGDPILMADLKKKFDAWDAKAGEKSQTTEEVPC